MSAEWAIGIMTAFVAIMLAVFGHLNARIKELNTAHQELANRVALECVTYERLEKIIQQSLGVVTSTLNRLETDLADLKPIKDSMIRLETKMALSS
jgi:glucokinase